MNNDNDEYSTVNLSYAILRNTDPNRLEIQVIKYMEEGWEPIGGIAVNTTQSSNGTFNYVMYTQSMVRK